MHVHAGIKSSGSTKPATRFLKRSCIGLAVAAVGIGVSMGTATAADNQNTTANAEVDPGITLTALVSSFTLTGTPGATVGTLTPVTYNVETNNLAGYSVTVQSATSTMVPGDVLANTDTIPIADLTVRESGGGPFSPVTAVGGTAVLVHSQDGRSANGGDNLSTDFQMRIPTVNADIYSASLNYLAAPTF